MEALTVLLALNAFNIKVPVHVRIDNTSALAAIRRGYSQGFRLNSVMQRLAVDDRSRFISSLQYIRSADNPSDGPSRLLQPQLVVNTGVVRGVFAAAAQLATTAVGVRGGTGRVDKGATCVVRPTACEASTSEVPCPSFPNRKCVVCTGESPSFPLTNWIPRISHAY